MTGAALGGALGASIGTRSTRGEHCTLNAVLRRALGHLRGLFTSGMSCTWMQACINQHSLQVPGLYKIRYIGQTTVSSAAVCQHQLQHLHLTPTSRHHTDVWAVFGGRVPVALRQGHGPINRCCVLQTCCCYAAAVLHMLYLLSSLVLLQHAITTPSCSLSWQPTAPMPAPVLRAYSHSPLVLWVCALPSPYSAYAPLLA